MILKNSENNGTEGIGLVTPTPVPQTAVDVGIAFVHMIKLTIKT